MSGGALTTECAVDGNPADGAVLCGRCADHLAGRLRQVPGLVEELITTTAKLDRRGEQVGKSGSDEQPLPYNDRASDIRRQLRDRLGLWVWAVAEHAGTPIGPRYDAEPAAWAARWLLEHPGAVRHYPAAGDLYEEVTEDVKAALKVIDLPPTLMLAGECGCGTVLYAAAGAEHTYCPAIGCGLSYRVDEQRAWLWRRLEDKQGTATQVASWLSDIGLKVQPATIRKWVARGKLSQPFCVGDVVTVLTGRTAA